MTDLTDELDSSLALRMTLYEEDELDCFVSFVMILLDDELLPIAIQEPSLQMCSTSQSAGLIIVPSLVASQGISEL